MSFGTPFANVLTNSVKQPYINQQAISESTQRIGNTIRGLTNAQTKKGTLSGGLRGFNSDSSKSRMALPLADTAQSGVKSMGNTQSNSDFDLYNKLSDRAIKDRGAMGSQDIDLTKRKITEVDTLANNEANRAYGMQLATQFPYQKYANESASARSIMDNSQAAIPTFLNRATASRLNPVSMSL